jgi:hypothetical protein
MILVSDMTVVVKVKSCYFFLTHICLAIMLGVNIKVETYSALVGVRLLKSLWVWVPAENELWSMYF